MMLAGARDSGGSSGEGRRPAPVLYRCSAAALAPASQHAISFSFGESLAGNAHPPGPELADVAGAPGAVAALGAPGVVGVIGTVGGGSVEHPAALATNATRAAAIRASRRASCRE